MWVVVRFVDIPENAMNDDAYDSRGWCFFESTVASIGAYRLETLDDGENCRNTAKTPVPLLPQRFNELLESKHFTQRGVDREMVKSLYARIFPTLCAKDSRMVVYSWGEADLEEFLPVLLRMPKLSKLWLRYSPITALPEELKVALETHFQGKAQHGLEIFDSSNNITMALTKGRWR